MKKHILLLVAFVAVSTTVHAQSRGVKIGYIDMEYILQMFLITLKLKIN